MNPPLDLVRSIDIEPGDGRELLGVAYRYDTPARVIDPGRPPYYEEFTRSAASKSIRQRATRPLMVMHDPKQTIGVASFEESADALLFRARVSETKEGDDKLQLVHDGALRSVSVRFRPLGSRKRTAPMGTVISRTEVAIRELSLAPTGFGQHPDAEVLVVRSEIEEVGTPRLDALRRRRSLLIMP